MYYTVFNEADLAIEECSDYVSRLNSNILSSFGGSLLVSFGSKIKKLNALDILRILYETEAFSKSEKILRSAVIEMVITAEKRIPGSSLYAILFFNFIFSKRNDVLEESNFLEDIKKLCSISSRTNLSTAINHIAALSKKDIEYELFKNIIELAGFNSTISVEEWEAWDSKIEISSYNSFDAFIPGNFSLSANLDTWECKNCDVIVVDGIIDSVSELHHTLENYNKSKKNLCLITRGFADDVISTLATNFLRKTLKVIPVQINVNLDTINSLKDISIISNADMVSSLKGDLISSIDLENVSSVFWIKATGKRFFINNPSTESKTATHISNLKKKISQENSEDVIKLLENRIASMAPKSAKIFLGKHLGEGTGLIKDRLKISISILNSICIFGILNLENVQMKNLNSTTNSIISLLRKNNVNSVPAASFIHGFKTGIMTANNLKKAGGFIVVDRD